MAASADKLPPEPGPILEQVAGVAPRLLVYGDMGTGKSTLTAALADAWRDGGPVRCVSADPGSPAFGAPGALSLAVRHDGAWQPVAQRPLCSLNAVRFRLPLIQAVTALVPRDADGPLLVDAPGVVHGVAGAEMLQGLHWAGGVDHVIVLERDGDPPLLAAELEALGCRVIRVRASAAAARPPPGDRAASRTRDWDDHLGDAERQAFVLSAVAVIGTPPPRGAAGAWRGRQAALLRAGESLAMGEIDSLEGEALTLRLPHPVAGADTLLLRDAWRNAGGALVTAPPARRPPLPAAGEAEPRAGQAPLSATVGGASVTLVNGVLGDPLLEVRIANRAGRMLFDLGDLSRLSPRALHEVTHVFVSHAHIDHIGGFPELLRARLSGELPPCRIYGPAGIRDHVAGFLAGVRWDRIGDTGPVFLVAEYAGGELAWWRLQPGHPPADLGIESAADGLLVADDAVGVRAATLDHGIPVLAFALDLSGTLHLREDRARERGLEPGPWVGELKRALRRGERDAVIELPDGGAESAGELGERLVAKDPGTRLAYATDFADSAGNRRILTALAREADLLVCEATFLDGDRAQAEATAHLTARACVEIALAAGAQRLLPFHFSRRYSRRLDDVYRALTDACDGEPLARNLLR